MPRICVDSQRGSQPSTISNSAFTVLVNTCRLPATRAASAPRATSSSLSSGMDMIPMKFMRASDMRASFSKLSPAMAPGVASTTSTLPRNSACSDSENVFTNAFVALYTAKLAHGLMPATDPMLRMPASPGGMASMAGRKRCVRATRLATLSAIMLSYSCRACASKGPALPTPALLIRMDTWRPAFATSSNSAWDDPAWERSTGKMYICRSGFFFKHSSRSCSRRSLRRAATASLEIPEVASSRPIL
mmetsp:Transcript_31847/g.79869  ORF Transcript_31847/g.79869 Transcript_31847/m.79869 type:complete len:247 (+) Transcript_31847:45-785(+)